MFQNQVQMHAWHLIINHCIYVFWIITGGDLNAFQQNWRWRKNHWVDSRTTRREDNNFQTLPSGRTTSSNRLKGIARWDSRLTDLQNRFFGRSPEGISLFQLRIKGIARWDSKLFEIARRDLVFRYWSKEVARRDLVFRLNKRNRQMGFQVDQRRSPEGISCFAIRRSPDGTSYFMLVERNRQMGFQVE